MNQDEKEILELAAKAAGLSFQSHNVTDHGVYCNDGTWWNPLTDGSAALRLAVSHVGMFMEDITSISATNSEAMKT